jgi:hypothetical protein
MLELMRTDHPAVIPGRAVSPNPKPNRKDKAHGWIPGPAFRPSRNDAPVDTFQADRVHDLGSMRSKIIVVGTESTGCAVASLPDLICPHVVIAGLDPAIHPFAKKMDARVEPAHDDVDTDPPSGMRA